MTDLPPELKAILAAARKEHEPRPEDDERVRAALTSALLVPEPLTPGVEPATSAAVGKGVVAATSLTGKVLLATVVLGASVGVWTWSARNDPRQEQADPSAALAGRVEAGLAGSSAQPASQPLPRRGTAVRAESAPAMPSNDAPLGSREPAAARVPPSRGERAALESPGMHASSPTTAAPHRAVRDVETAPTTGQDSSGDEGAGREPSRTATREGELRLMQAALTAINNNAAARGLALLADHAARYPSGLLVAERQGLRVVALCASGATAMGRAEQAAFLRVHGSIPLATRVRASCQDKEP